MIGPTGATVIGGLLIVGAFLTSLIPGPSDVSGVGLPDVVARVAAAVVGVSWANRGVARLRQRRRS